MKQTKLFLSLLMLVVFGIGNVWGAEVSLTQNEIKKSTANGSYKETSVVSGSGTWSGNMIVNTTTGYVQINKNKNNYYLKSPVFAGGVTKVVINTCNNTAENRTFYLRSNTQTAQPTSGEYGSGQTSSKNGSVTISVTNAPTSFYIYSDGTAYISSVVVTYETGSSTEPSLDVDKTVIDFGTVEQGAAVAAQMVAVTMANVETVMAGFETDCTAFSVSPDELSTSGDLTITPNTSVAVGEYTSTLTITDAEKLSKDVVVKMNVVKPFEGKKIEFDLTKNNLGLPLTKSNSKAGEYIYKLNGTDYKFYATDVQGSSEGGIYFSTSYVMIYDKNSLGLPALNGYKLVKVEVTNSNGCSTSTNVSITTDETNTVAGGDAKVFNATSTTYTFSLSGTTANTMYYLTVTNKNCQVTGLTLYYEAVEPTKSAITLNVNPEDAAFVGATYGNPATEIESETTLVPEDATVKLSYIAEDNYRFKKWEVKDANNKDIKPTKVEGTEDYTFTMPASAVTATANFDQLFTIAQDAVVGGTLTISAASAAKGDEVTITATPASKYKDPVIVVYKEGDAATTYTVTDGKFIMPGNAVRVKVTFTEITCTQLATPEVTIGETTYKTATISWNPVEYADKYKVILQDESCTNVSETETAECTYTFTDLAANTSYIYIVKAVSNDADTYCESEEASDVISTTDYPAATLTLSENGNEVLFEGTHKINDVVTLPTDIDNLCVGKQLVGWSEVQIETPSATEPTSQYYKAGAQYTLKDETQTLYAVYATVDAGTKDVKLNIEDYATANEWSNGTAYTNVTIDGVTFSVTGGRNNGKFYTSNNTWRFYDGGSLTISATEQIVSITPVPSSATFTQQENGAYKFSGEAEIKEIIVRIAYSNIAGFTTACTASIAAPTFTPTSTVFNTEDVVMLENIVNGATVYYTINGEDPTTTSAVYDADNGIELTENGEYVIKAIAVKGEAQSEVVTATYGVLKPFSSLQELIDCKYAEGKVVTVSFSDIAITKISGKQVTLDSKKDEKNVMIYNSTEIPTEWSAKEKGKLSATSIKCEWKKYINKEFIGWELTPSDWTGFTYTNPEHIISLEISGDVTEKTYSEGQQLKSDGLIVTGIYSDNTEEAHHKETITEGLSWTLPTLTEGQTEAQVTVSYTEPILGKTITSEEYTIRGLNVSAPRILDHIEIATESTQQTDFFVGRPFTREGLKVLAYYSVSGVITGDPVDVTGAYSHTDPDMTKEGKQTITITYTENEVSKTTTYDINLKYMDLTNLVNSTEINDGDYVYVKFKDVMITNLYKGRKGDYMGIYLNVQKDNKEIEIYSSTKIPDEWQVEVYGTVSGTLDNVLWTYYEKNDVWELKPSNWDDITYKAPVIEALTISGTATTLTYTEGATFDPTGLKVEATIAGEKRDVTDRVTWTFDPTTLAEGTTSVTAKATYKEKEATTIIDVTVNPAPTFNSLEELIAATDVESGDIVRVTLTNIKIEAFYEAQEDDQVHFVALENKKETKEIDIYHSTIVPDAWVKGGTLSGTIYATWKFDSEDDCWYIVPIADNWDWAKLTYADPIMEGDPIVIAFEYSGAYYALKTDLTVYTFSKNAVVVANNVINFPEADRTDITWYRTMVEGGATFQNKNGEYLTTGTSNTCATSEEPTIWKYSGSYYYQTVGRTLLYRGDTYKTIKEYSTQNIKGQEYSDVAMYLSFADGMVRSTTGNIGTICLPYAVKENEYIGASFYKIAYKELDAKGNPYKVFFDEVTELEVGKPYIFVPQEGAKQVAVLYSGEKATTAGSENGLVGTFTSIDDQKEGNPNNVLEGKYIIYDNQLHKCTEYCGLDPYRAYVDMDQVPNKENAPAPAPGRRRIALGNADNKTTTGVDNMVDGNILREGIYDVLGRKLAAPQGTGFYIINGRKVMIVR